VAELMRQIPLVPIEAPLKNNKLADRVGRRNPKVYDGNYYLIVLGEWVRGMEKIFIVVEVPEKKKANVGTYYLTSETNIW